MYYIMNVLSFIAKIVGNLTCQLFSEAEKISDKKYFGQKMLQKIVNSL